MTDPNEWREVWPDAAEAVYDALGGLRDALSRLATSSGDPMASAAAREWVITALREEAESDFVRDWRTDESGRAE